MLQMNYWTDKWDLHEDICPCDVHFNDWVAEKKLTGKDIFHFGTGTHHVIGRTQAENGSGNAVMGITASIEEYEAYIDLVSNNSRVNRSYIAYFADIYLTNRRLLPEFDIVTMFHLCEFFFPNTASAEYGGMTDPQMLDLFTEKTRPGGAILFYTALGLLREKPRRCCRNGKNGTTSCATASSRRCWPIARRPEASRTCQPSAHSHASRNREAGRCLS